jgi:hypothetical protein
MQLPKWAFGRIWPIGFSDPSVDDTPDYKLSHIALPEWCVLWEFQAMMTRAVAALGEISLALGDQLPADVDAFNRLEKVFKGWHSLTSGEGYTNLSVEAALRMENIRMPIKTSGRRFVSSFDRFLGTANGFTMILMVSGLPRSVPEWLIYPEGENLKS